ncbi:MAG TPA: hypothetical protein VKH41_11770 [Myxococcota bacterium]|nr:hypothetical protein [Myxococcota bacterium]
MPENVTRVVADQSSIEAAERARAAEESPQDAAREAALGQVRKFVAGGGTGTHRTDARGYQQNQVQRATIPRTQLIDGQESVRIGAITTSPAGARNAGLIDADGNLTEKGRLVADGGKDRLPAERAPQQAADHADRVRPGHARAEGFTFVAMKAGESLSNIPEADIRSISEKLRAAQGRLSPDERAAAERDVQSLQAELAKRRGEVVQPAPNAEQASDTAAGDQGISAQLAQTVGERVAEGSFETAIQASGAHRQRAQPEPGLSVRPQRLPRRR